MSHQKRYRTLNVEEDVHLQVEAWADHRKVTISEAVEYAFDMLGPPPQDRRHDDEVQEDQRGPREGS